MSREELTKSEHRPTPFDPRYRCRRIELGVPSSHNSHRQLDISPRLVIAVIEAHISDKERELKEVSIAAKIELESDARD
jgi:hypothetical protein